MKKSVIIIISIILFILFGFYLIIQKNNNKSNISKYSTSKLNSNENTSIPSEKTDSSDEKNKNNNNNDKDDKDATKKQKKIETEISSYITKIRTKYPERQNNISLACSTLNDTIVEKNETFSFCNTLGKATKAKGYEEANVFQDGEEISALGGGKCQVSSTLYNAVLAVPELEIVERHPHSGKVYYVPVGKDAAVSYGSYDFKFKNNTGSQIKIKASNNEDELKISILKIE